MNNVTRITVIEDNEAVKDGLALIIGSQQRFQVVNTYTNCIDALKNLRRDMPDLVLIDLELPGMHGIEGIKRILRERPHTTLLVVSVHEDSKLVFEALCAGASGYLTKDTDHIRLLNAIDEVLSGGAPMSSKIASLVVKSFQRNLNSPLSDRETDVLTLLSKGKTYHSIADELFISVETVKTHIRNIYQKLHVTNKTEALKKAVKDKLI
ncbi:response regulator transcription factor [Runella sp. MFBS21]|jgi:DNA-binding NarL/FixJ family response regulator|uniref:response regulator transcription factor n=1 Tax=Runella TaxID=105 RepID=UPI000418BAF0|nr:MULTISPECIES: response regulator transcription factor [Runella]MDF7817612.1 response regulator transcription factor [Runella sp. MFBS21]